MPGLHQARHGGGYGKVEDEDPLAYWGGLPPIAGRPEACLCGRGVVRAQLYD